MSLSKITSQEKYELYKKAFFSAGADTKKLIIYGIKMVNAKPEPSTISGDEVLKDFQVADFIHGLIGKLKPLEFVNLFPINKDYDGKKYQTKDYFYTRDYIKTLPDEPIGDSETVMKFLWEYHNWEITEFEVEVFGYMSDLRRAQGEPSLMEEWATQNGVKTYTMHKNSKGKMFVVDKETGKSFRVRKKRPRYLKLVKRGQRSEKLTDIQ